ncbi:MAG: hypothetical protein QOE68_2680 [Thermoanaerobaculia bacterium]|jgi:hypothetical protein|nr:hypothetical protein [Thermoanaerobaculia bacterium]
MTEPAAIRRAIEKGVAFLESVQLPSGEIPIDMSPTPEMSGECVRDPVIFPAALAARALSITPSAARVRSRALDFLLREMEPGGLWRYPSSEHPGHDHIPLDVDDTSIASAALRAAGRHFPNNRALLLANRDRRGRFRTWIVRWWPHPRKIYHFFHDTTAEIRDVDAAIEANVVSYLGFCEETRPAIANMLAVLRANGEMTSTKWYESRFAVWYFFSHALREIAPEAGEMIVPRIEGATPRNALDLALAASALLLWNRTPDVHPLLDAQLPSGAWPSSAFYHAGLKRISPNEFQPTPPWWGSEALTTVLAVEALSRRIA